jgi:hypothetical protein
MTKQRSFRVLLAILVAIGAIAAGVVGADLYFSDGNPEGPVPSSVLPVVAGQGAEANAPGGLLGAVEARVAEPPFGEPASEAPPVALGVRFGGQDASGASLGDQGDASSPAADYSPHMTVGEVADSGTLLGTILRWLDMCAVGGAAGCPLGVAATILPLAELFPALQVQAFPEATSATFPDLRCDPGWPSQSTIPIVVASNRPLDFLDVYVRTSDGIIWGLETNLASPAWESVRFEALRANGEAVFADVATGVHTCVTMRLHADTPRGDTFELKLTARAGEDEVDLVVPFAGVFGTGRPPVTLHPQNEYRATVRVPQRYEDQTAVWLSAGSNWQAACDSVPADALIDVALSRIPDSVLNDDAYPWDPDYDHVTYRHLRLHHSSEYTLCVHWMDEGVTEAWILETPDGWHLDIISGVLAHRVNTSRGLLGVRFENVGGCDTATFASGPLPNVDLQGFGGYHEVVGDRICRSFGPFEDGYVVPVRAGSEEREAFRVIVPFGLLDRCAVGANAVGFPCQQMLRWNHTHLIRGNGLDIDWDIIESLFRLAISGGSDIDAIITLADSVINPPQDREPDPWMLQIDFETQRITTNNRPHPLDWGFTQMLRHTG